MCLGPPPQILERHGQVVGRQHVARVGLDRRAILGDCLFGLPAIGQHQPEMVPRVGMPPVDGRRSCQHTFGLGQSPELSQRQSQIVERLQRVGREGAGGHQRFHSGLRAALLQSQRGEGAIGLRIAGGRVDGLGEVVCRFVEAAQLLQHHAEILARGEISAVETYGRRQGRSRLVEPARGPQGQSEV